MNISFNWLKEYLQFDLSPDEVGEILTDGGLEVEGIEEIQSVEGGLEGLVVGEVTSCAKHPNADKLSVTTVNIGEGEDLPIVCGAPNVAKGQKVVVALVGSTLYPKNGEAFKIKKSKIRGEVSEGMICAEDEIGVGESHDGIMVLKPDTAVGTAAAEYFGLESDHQIHIGLTPNRADGMSHYGVARDLLALLNQKGIAHGGLQFPGTELNTSSVKFPIEVTVEDHEACPRYVGLYIEGVEVKASPDWLKQRLQSIGLKPINNVVDVTNFVLHELGQPLHAFDADRITGNQVIVKTLNEGSKFTTLDEEERVLSGQDLMICNAEEGMCIAGVFGGIKSGVTESTSRVFLESAYFHPVWVRKTAKRHGLNTDASFRFERGIDPEITVEAGKRAAQLIKEVAGGEVSAEIVDIYPTPVEGFRTLLRYDRCNELIGSNIPKDDIKRILSDLQIEIEKEHDGGLEVYIPPFKVDVQREIDVIEEILRVYGYNQVDFPDKLSFSLLETEKGQYEGSLQKVMNLLSDKGFLEMMNNSLTKSDYYEGSESTIEILNPLSGDLDALRESMLPNGLEVIAYNQNRHQSDLRLFEYGKTYHQYAEERVETEHLAIYLSGNHHSGNWKTPQETSDFFHLKGILEAIVERLGITGPGMTWKEGSNDRFELSVNLVILGKTVAELGSVHSGLLRNFDVKSEVFFADINWTVVKDLLKLNKVKYKEVPKFPSVQRDLALLVKKEVQFQDIKEVAHKTEKRILRSVDIFDIYQGKGLEADEKSYGIRFEFRDDEKTLTDKVVDKTMKKIFQQLESKTGACLRSGEI